MDARSSNPRGSVPSVERACIGLFLCIKRSQIGSREDTQPMLAQQSSGVLVKPSLLSSVVAVSAYLAIPQPAAAQAPTAPVGAEDARLTAFLDGEFAQLLKMQPQTATRL